jgi:TetR/AcrR family transcriptional repressor of nem operon
MAVLFFNVKRIFTFMTDATPAIAPAPLPDDILDKAMQLFWQKGYFNTSISELVHVTHTNRAALYKTYGGKNGLFLSMLKRYKENVTSHVFAHLETDNPGLEAIEAFFSDLTHPENIEKFQCGCFLINTAADLPSHNEAISGFIYEYIDELKSLFIRNLKEDASYSTLGDEKLNSIADFLIGNVFGIFIMMRSDSATDRVTNQIKTIVDTLISPSQPLSKEKIHV